MVTGPTVAAGPVTDGRLRLSVHVVVLVVEFQEGVLVEAADQAIVGARLERAHRVVVGERLQVDRGADLADHHHTVERLQLRHVERAQRTVAALQQLQHRLTDALHRRDLLVTGYALPAAASATRINAETLGTR